ncbi:hypothetical protein DFH94DRAFT_143791 [Russula ochroleuca]|uniref:Uncharacterized protein n=1 Tax=Russula ochroleuca TaxID=152965 RepID=A0A9P5JZY9_9AGAM|nr:hypothetical protein DFH94DRAFT_143791 [Russula ochroleuca]
MSAFQRTPVEQHGTLDYGPSQFTIPTQSLYHFLQHHALTEHPSSGSMRRTRVKRRGRPNYAASWFSIPAESLYQSLQPYALTEHPSSGSWPEINTARRPLPLHSLLFSGRSGPNIRTVSKCSLTIRHLIVGTKLLRTNVVCRVFPVPLHSLLRQRSSSVRTINSMHSTHRAPVM